MTGLLVGIQRRCRTGSSAHITDADATDTFSGRAEWLQRTKRTTRIRVDVAREAARDRQQGRPRRARKRHGPRVDGRRSAIGRPQGRSGESRRTRPSHYRSEAQPATRRIETPDSGAFRCRRDSSERPSAHRDPTTWRRRTMVKTRSTWHRVLARWRCRHRRDTRSPGLQGHPRGRSLQRRPNHRRRPPT